MIESIQREIESLNNWENLVAADNGKVGKFLKKELNSMLNDVRHLYINIRANQPDASMQLLSLQVEERVISKILEKMNNITEKKLDLDKQMQIVSNLAVSEESVSEPFR